jgi:hypothetical protein
MQPHRPTRDLDLLGYGESTSSRLVEVFQRICACSVEEDGLVFDLDSVRAQPIRLDQEYLGQRVELNAFLGRARIPLQIDVGFGDVVTPPPEEAEYPALLPFPAPRLRVYPKEAVAAEKIHAMVVLGSLNSRMKDFYDIWVLAQATTFDGALLRQAIAATFAQRGTPLPASCPVALTAEFAQRPDVQNLWQAFLRRNRLSVGTRTFPSLLTELSDFLMPVLAPPTGSASFGLTWPPGGPWRDTK